MSRFLNELGIDQWSVADRLKLVQEIWDSIGPEAEQIPLTEAQGLELNRRIARLEADPNAVVPWEVVEARALKRLGR